MGGGNYLRESWWGALVDNVLEERMIDLTKNRPMTERQYMLLTVGQGEGDLQGDDDKILQAGADYLHRLGGGTFHVLPGEYTMRNALYVHPSLVVKGSGAKPVLKKIPEFKTKLVRDSDW